MCKYSDPGMSSWNCCEKYMLKVNFAQTIPDMNRGDGGSEWNTKMYTRYWKST